MVMKKKLTPAGSANRHPLEIRETKSGRALVLEFNGRLDATTSAGALEKLTASIEVGEQQLVLDFSQLDYISSAGLKTLLVVLNKLPPLHGTIALCSLKPYLKEIIDIAGLTALFPVYPSRAEALKSLQ